MEKNGGCFIAMLAYQRVPEYGVHNSSFQLTDDLMKTPLQGTFRCGRVWMNFFERNGVPLNHPWL